jgi:hypothetical protein
MSGANREKGCNAAMVLKHGETDQATVKGINSLTLPSLTRSVITSEEFGVDFASSDAGGGKYGDIQYSGNAITGDTKGQDQLKAYLIANTKFTDARLYISTVTGHFLAADTAQDTEAGFQVVEHTPGAVGVNDTFKFSGKWCVNGRFAIFTVHKADVATPTMAFVASATPLTVGATITDSSSGFVTAGFKAGQTLIIEGSTSNDGTYLIKTVVEGTITLDILGSVSQLVAEPALATTILHGGTL